MNVQDISFVDKPKLGLTNYVGLMVGYLGATYFLVTGLQGLSSMVWSFFVTFILLAMAVPIHYCWINTVYELSNSQLRIRSGFYQKIINLELISSIKVDREYSPRNIPLPAVKFRDRVWLFGGFGRIMITPDDPVVFIEELQKRVPHLEVEGI